MQNQILVIEKLLKEVPLMLDPLSKLLFQNAGSHGPIVLMYHSVLPFGTTRNDWPWAVTCENFYQQMKLIKQSGWKTIRLKDLSDPKLCLAKTVVITFDDGYEDNLQAFEILMEFKMNASWFVVTNDIGKKSSWIEPGFNNRQILSSQALRHFSDSGMEVASHTCTHSRLIQLNDTHLFNELSQSKKTLEDICGVEVESFAYPYGIYDERCAQAVNDTGYKYACTTKTGWSLAGGDYLTIRRLSIFSNDTISSFARKLAFSANDVGFRAQLGYYVSRMKQRFLRTR